MNDFNIACFLSVVRTLSFALSAEELYITQQAVSRNIQTLETELGFLLFHRHYHSIRLTLAGEELYKTFSDFSHKRSICSRVIEDEHSPETLRIGCTAWSGMPQEISAGINLFAELNGKPPIIRVLEVSDGEIKKLLETGEADIAFVSRYLADSFGDDYTVFPILEIPLYIVIEVDHALISLPSISDVLMNLPHITTYAIETDEETVKLRVFREYIELDYRPKTIAVLPNLESVFTDVLMGNGITFSPVNRFTKCEDLSIFPLPLTVTICTVRLRDNENRRVLGLEHFLAERRSNSL